MKRIATAALLTATSALALAGSIQGSASAAGKSLYGCPSGAVCLYSSTTNTANPTGPHTDYYSYGAHRLSNVTGYHFVVNNQTGGAKAYLCTDSAGTRCPSLFPQIGYHYIHAGDNVRWNMTPIYSIKLTR